MKNTKIFIVPFILVMFLSCNNDTNHRNKIEFQNKNSEVQDSIIKIIALLKKIQDPSNVNKGYDYRKDDLFINNVKTNIAHIGAIFALSKFTDNEKRQFVNLTRYLKLNNISSGSYDTYLKLWVF